MSKAVAWEIWQNGAYIGTTHSLQIAEAAAERGCTVIQYTL